MKTLKEILRDANLNLSTNPKGTDKGDFKSYVDGFYEREFAALRSTATHVLELGVRTGASLRLWSEYFSSATIHGVDNESGGAFFMPVDEWVRRERVIYHKASAYDAQFANSLQKQFDIIIDDGPHTLSSQMTGLRLYLPKLKPGGIYVIEDVRWNYVSALALKRAVRLHGRYTFETHDFTSNKGFGDDFIVVVRYAPTSRALSVVQDLEMCARIGPAFARSLGRRVRHYSKRVSTKRASPAA